MSGATSIFGARGDGVSSSTKAGFKKSGLNADGGYEAPPPPPVPAPPPPPIKEQQSQVGSTQLNNPEGLKKALKARGMSDAEVEAKVKGHKQQKGYQ